MIRRIDQAALSALCAHMTANPADARVIVFGKGGPEVKGAPAPAVLALAQKVRPGAGKATPPVPAAAAGTIP